MMEGSFDFRGVRDFTLTVGPVISTSLSAGSVGGREKVVCKRTSAAVERTASHT